jgi:hypothetical protein
MKNVRQEGRSSIMLVRWMDQLVFKNTPVLRVYDLKYLLLALKYLP